MSKFELLNTIQKTINIIPLITFIDRLKKKIGAKYKIFNLSFKNES